MTILSCSAWQVPTDCHDCDRNCYCGTFGEWPGIWLCDKCWLVRAKALCEQDELAKAD
jgi:hypothetical protein